MQIIKNNKGFTLIEMAIVMLIIGVMFAGLALGLRAYNDTRRHELGVKNIENSKQSISEFASTYGRYPCPADPKLAINSPSFGEEDCNSPQILGSRDTEADADADEDNILAGFLPIYAYAVDPSDASFDPDEHTIYLQKLVDFKDFSEASKDIKDPWATSNRFSYFVSESLTDTGTFDPDNGVISVTDESEQLTGGLSNSGNAHYAIISHGENGLGCNFWIDNRNYLIDKANESGQDFLAMDAAAQDAFKLSVENVQTHEEENCDGDEEFRFALQSRGGAAANYYDDLIQFYTYETLEMWSTVMNEVNSDDVFMTTDGKLAIGDDYAPNGSSTGDFQFDFADDNNYPTTLKVDVDGDIVVEKNVAAFLICDDTDLDTCFRPQSFYDLECPTQGQYMKEIYASSDKHWLTVKCEPIDFKEVSCNSDEFLNGMYTDGENTICAPARTPIF